MGQRCVVQCKHRRKGLPDLARDLERLLGVCERGLGMAKRPQGQRPNGQGCHRSVGGQIPPPVDDVLED